MHLLLDESRVFDGEQSADSRLFRDQLGRVLEHRLREVVASIPADAERAGRA